MTSSRRPVVLVGIGGLSGGGKSTLARAIAEHFRSPVHTISGDVFFTPWKMPQHPRWGENWETPAGIDWELMLEGVRSVVSQLAVTDCVPDKVAMKVPGRKDGQVRWDNIARPEQVGEPLASGPVIVVVEGFLLYYAEDIARACHCRLWLDSDMDTALRRRYLRSRRPGPLEQFAEWYESLVWPHYLEHLPVQLANAEPYFQLDGLLPTEKLLALAVDQVSSYLGQLAMPPLALDVLAAATLEQGPSEAPDAVSQEPRA